MGKFSNKKIVVALLAGAAVLLFLFLVLLGGTIFAWRSNNNVPVFSEIVEVVEQATWDASKNENRLVSSMFSPLTSLASTNGEAPSNEELQKFFSDNSETYHSYDYDLTVYVKSDVDGSNQETTSLEGEFTFNMKGDVSSKDENLLLNSAISGEYKAEGTTLTGDGEMRIVDETFYARANSLPTFGTTSFDQYQGQWYEQDITDYLDELYAQESEDEIDEEVLRDLYEVITSENVLSSIEKMPDEIYGDVRTYCFRLDMSGEEIAQLIKDLQESMEDNSDENNLFAGYQYTEEELKDIEETFEKVLIDWCIGRKDGLPYKYVIEMVMSEESTDQTITLKVDMRLSNYNKEVTVEKPSDTKTFEELYNEIIPPVEDDYYYDDQYYYEDEYYYDDEYNFDDYYFEDLEYQY